MGASLINPSVDYAEIGSGFEKFPTPRPHQLTSLKKLKDGAMAGHRKQVLMAPTGSGKSITALMLIHQALKKGKRAMFVANRNTIIGQISEAADSFGLGDYGIIQSGSWRYDLTRPFQIASVQTLARRSWPEVDLIVIDEVQYRYETWVKNIDATSAHVLSLSATPFSKGLGKLFTNLVNAATMHELTQQGILVPMRVMSCKQIDMDGAKTANGEWQDSSAAERGMEIVGDVVAEWLSHAENRKTIVFGATIHHCEEMARQFSEAGVIASVFSAHTKDDERKEILDEFRKPDSMIRVLISVEALAAGFDVPDIGCVVDCRPLRKSLSTFIQMIGRGLRSSPSTGKENCIIMDHSGNFIRFADDFSDIYYNGLDELDAGEKLDKEIRNNKKDKLPDKCPSCGFSPCGKRCISCGHERKPKGLIEHVPGVMTEAVMIGKNKLADTKKNLYEQICTYTRAHGTPGKEAGWAYHLFKGITGSDPSPFWKFDSQPDVQISEATNNQIMRERIAYQHRIKGTKKRKRA